MSGEVFDADYFLRGVETGKSLYRDYRWLCDLTVPMCKAIAAHCGFTPDDLVCDFGCARGYVVKALRLLGYKAFGIDVSSWAIENCDPEVVPYVSRTAEVQDCDWVIAKDVLEHVEDVKAVAGKMLDRTRKGIFVVVPLATEVGMPYDVAEYEADCTHKHRMPLHDWMRLFIRSGWSVEARYRLEGVKDNYASAETGNGFLTCRRIG